MKQLSGTIDFLAEDVWQNDAAVNAYYKLLNCGFRIGWAAGTDFPCTSIKSPGYFLTYVDIKDKPLTYRNWIQGIKYGRTVVSLNGHDEFLDLRVNGSITPGDEIKLKGMGGVALKVGWTVTSEMSGRIELVCNGKVVAVKDGSSLPGNPLVLETSLEIKQSSWICARRMDEKGHQSHTSPVYITINNKPVRASAEDAQYFIKWIDNMIEKTNTGGTWNKYFTTNLDFVQKRYRKAKSIYLKIYKEAGAIAI